MNDTLTILLPKLIILGFIMAFGASVGSLVNVLVYRLPLGLDVVSPTSRCPKCNTKLTWRENIPIFGWLILRGKCRFCKASISPEYPIVESVVAGLFGLLYALWYLVEPGSSLLGIPFGDLAPEWARNGPAMTWPALVVLLILLGSLVAMTIIDARTYTIPLVLTWVPAMVALLFHTGHAIWFTTTKGTLEPVVAGYWNFSDSFGRWVTAPNAIWTIPTPGFGSWRFIGITLGATLGLFIANMMLKHKLLTRSFADYDQWFQEHSSSDPNTTEKADNQSHDSELQSESQSILESKLALTPIPQSESMEFPQTDSSELQPDSDPDSIPNPGPDLQTSEPQSSNESPEPAGAEPDTHAPTQEWIMYPYARREMIRELAFLAPVAACAMFGGWLAVLLVTHFAGAWTINPINGTMIAPMQAPLWLVVFSGVLAGYLIGGGVVWAVRILGSLLFNKEAMGLGDVHMMAAVGACMGWIDSTFAFFIAAFVALFIAAMTGLLGKGKFLKPIPYGPSLAIATLLVLFLKPIVEWGLGLILKMEGPFNLP
ncbi:MAG: prepilin peptidase [Phycisphaerales bacterium]